MSYLLLLKISVSHALCSSIADGCFSDFYEHFRKNTLQVLPFSNVNVESVLAEREYKDTLARLMVLFSSCSDLLSSEYLERHIEQGGKTVEVKVRISFLCFSF